MEARVREVNLKRKAERKVKGRRGKTKRRPSNAPGHPVTLFASDRSRCHAVKLVPHPHPPVAFGLLKVKPDPCIEVT
jgi:hypothetical protein